MVNPTRPVHNEPWFWLLIGAGVLFRVVTTIVCLIVFSFAVTFPYDQFFMDRPAETSLVGTYRLTEASKEFLMEREGHENVPDTEIILRADGTISVHDFPRELVVDEGWQSTGQFVSAEGTWSISDDWPGYAIDVNIGAGQEMPETSWPSMFSIRRAHFPHVLEFTVGDPDSGESIKFELQSAQTALQSVSQSPQLSNGKR